jgi:uncharacterized protein (UPF0276 family)
MSEYALDREPLSPRRGERELRGSRWRRTGIGLRAPHHEDILARRPSVGFVEAHCENYFAAGGSQREYLRRIRADYALSLHGVGLSLGSSDPIDREHLGCIGRLVWEFEPMLVSEHLSWGSIGGRHVNDLLPLPYTEEALQHMIGRVRLMQESLERQILIENVSSYLRFTCSQMEEWEFLAELARESGCGILLDVNNVYVSAKNHGFDPHRYLQAMPRSAVQEIHLAGHTINRSGEREIRIDSHDQPVCAAVWDLYSLAIQRFGPIPTLIEWDADLPALDVLVAEARHADQITEQLDVAVA